MLRYSLSDFYQILETQEINQIPEDIIIIINKLANEVGCSRIYKNSTI